MGNLEEEKVRGRYRFDLCFIIQKIIHTHIIQTKIRTWFNYSSTVRIETTTKNKLDIVYVLYFLHYFSFRFPLLWYSFNFQTLTKPYYMSKATNSG